MLTDTKFDENVSFPCSSEFKVGAILLAEGDIVSAVGDGSGLYSIHVDWGEGAIARLNAHDVNKLAGYEVIGESPCFCFEMIGDNDKCKRHWKGGK